MLAARDGKGRLPNGYLTALVERTGKSRAELKFRSQFAATYPTEGELATAVASCSSWTDLRDSLKRAPEPTPDLAPAPVTGDDYYTDECIIKASRDVMGGIDLDPASHPVANSVVQAAQIYGISDNDLTQAWKGRVWVNPPFGQWEVWAQKIVSEWRSGRISEMCVLAATRSITARCFSPLLASCVGAVILHGRIPFWGPKTNGSPDDGHVVLYYGRDIDGFVERFQHLGNVFSLSAPCLQVPPQPTAASVTQNSSTTTSSTGSRQHQGGGRGCVAFNHRARV